MSILDQVKRARAELASTAPAPLPAPASPPAQDDDPSPVEPAAAPHAAHDVPEWTSGTSRLSRIQAERNEAYAELKSRIHEDLITELDPEQLTGDTSLNSPIRRAVEATADERLAQLDSTLSRQDRLRLASEIADEVLGYGPLEPLLRDPTVTELMVNGSELIFYERAGSIQLSEYRFRDDNHVINVIDKMLRPLGRRLDESSPMVDARLPDGSRINAIIPRWLSRVRH